MRRIIICLVCFILLAFISTNINAKEIQRGEIKMARAKDKYNVTWEGTHKPLGADLPNVSWKIEIKVDNEKLKIRKKEKVDGLDCEVIITANKKGKLLYHGIKNGVLKFGREQYTIDATKIDLLQKGKPILKWKIDMLVTPKNLPTINPSDDPGSPSDPPR